MRSLEATVSTMFPSERLSLVQLEDIRTYLDILTRSSSYPQGKEFVSDIICCTVQVQNWTVS